MAFDKLNASSNYAFYLVDQTESFKRTLSEYQVSISDVWFYFIENFAINLFYLFKIFFKKLFVNALKNFGEKISVLSQELETIEPELRKSYLNVEVIEQEMKHMKSMIKEIS